MREDLAKELEARRKSAQALAEKAADAVRPLTAILKSDIAVGEAWASVYAESWVPESLDDAACDAYAAYAAAQELAGTAAAGDAG